MPKRKGLSISFRRLNIALPVYFRVFIDDVTHISTQVLSGLTRNVGEGGLSIEVDGLTSKWIERLSSKQAKLSLKLNLPNSPYPVQAMAKVIWTERVGDGAANRYHIGLTYLDIDKKDLDRMIDYALEVHREPKRMTALVSILILVAGFLIFYGWSLGKRVVSLEKSLAGLNVWRQGQTDVLTELKGKNILDKSSAVFLEELLIRADEQRVLLDDRLSRIEAGRSYLEQQLTEMARVLEASQRGGFFKVAVETEFVNKIGEDIVYAELLSFGIEDGQFIGRIKNKAEVGGPGFSSLNFKIIIEYYDKVKGLNFTCEPIFIEVQNQAEEYFFSRDRTKGVISPDSIENVKMKVEQALSDGEPGEEIRE